ncbi:PAS domain S-box-containing protein [Paucidesulfovibrio gracilis DSM 16080]|uniref:PAS domain S-box-containing protein n=1 Tax=Paucidesulfovibrio gracilis DSM 16080 TaxID=1121449 RepID=A0A1T4W1T8_9BACT|nr:sigma 54-interacting transcriptional regulator [Paucidesulfovibrio gracilis]SKA71109.1 PAS domain S-box-containing protein [Paucidesulfovibrio gracilis DSM 16080]
MTEQEINLYLREILNTMQDGLFLTRPDGTIMMVNDALVRMTGYSREELLNAPCCVLDCDVCHRSRAEGQKHWCRLFKVRRENMKSCHIRRKDGEYIHVVKNASLLEDGDGIVLGAVETLTDITELDARDRKIKELSRLLDGEHRFYGMVGHSTVMRNVFALLERAAQSDAPVIIHGESGTGKELAAAAIHALGPRRDGPFVQINCAALNESLLESEIFGHVKGAFTGAYRHRKGRFEEARGGDVFLDEIGDIPPAVQVKLLRVLETRSFERVGDNRPLRLDARLISATNQDLRSLVDQGRFRKDFFYRINVIPIHLPPLRERREDIPLLAEHFLKQHGRAVDQDSTNSPETHRIPSANSIGTQAMERLMEYSWPGNVRELKSALEYAGVVCREEVIGPEHLPPQLTAPRTSVGRTNLSPASVAGTRDERQKQELVHALRETNGNKSATARLLGISRVTVLNRMRKYGIDLQKKLIS